jgi:hypothetical protein
MVSTRPVYDTLVARKQSRSALRLMTRSPAGGDRVSISPDELRHFPNFPPSRSSFKVPPVLGPQGRGRAAKTFDIKLAVARRIQDQTLSGVVFCALDLSSSAIDNPSAFLRGSVWMNSSHPAWTKAHRADAMVGWPGWPGQGLPGTWRYDGHARFFLLFISARFFEVQRTTLLRSVSHVGDPARLEFQRSPCGII